MKLLANELIFVPREGFCSHASQVTVLPDQSVYVVFFGGTREGADDVRIYGSLRQNGAWEEPVALTADDGVPHWNPVLFQPGDGSLVLLYKVGKPIADWKTYYKISCDHGRTWTEAQELVPGDTSGGRGPVRNHILTCADGTLLAPASVERECWSCFFDRSVDGGRTWQRSEDLSLPERKPGKGIIQPTLWESQRGIHGLMRSTEGVLYRTDSLDGLSWSAPCKTQIPNNNSGVEIARIADGRLFLVLNPTMGNFAARTPLSLWESCDDGQSFHPYTDLLTGEGEFSYPAIEAHGNTLYITSTWKRLSVAFLCLEV